MRHGRSTLRAGTADLPASLLVVDGVPRYRPPPRGQVAAQVPWVSPNHGQAPRRRIYSNAALALTKAATRLSDSVDPIPHEIWREAARFFDEKALATLILSISLINVWNRLNVSTRQIAGE